MGLYSVCIWYYKVLEIIVVLIELVLLMYCCPEMIWLMLYIVLGLHHILGCCLRLHHILGWCHWWKHLEWSSWLGLCFLCFMHGWLNLRITESETSRELAVWQSKHSFYLVNLRVLDCHRQHTFKYWKFKLQWIMTKEMRFYFDISFSPYTPPIFLVSRRPKRPLDQKYKVCKRQKVNVKYFDISFVFCVKEVKKWAWLIIKLWV